GYHPQVILAGRRINDGMGAYVAQETVKNMIANGVQVKGAKVNVLGLTFKENCPDLRNSKVADVIAELQALGHQVAVHDPHADGAEALLEYGLHLAGDAFEQTYDMVFLAVPHKYYLAAGVERIAALVAPGGTLADLKGVLGERADWRL
ncbi:MAG: UDP-N-acetyl-D-galactosamine dehydrogenase, partial [Novosphingobium sp. 16-62-11]